MRDDLRHREWGDSNVDEAVVLFSTLQELRYCTLKLQKIWCGAVQPAAVSGGCFVAIVAEASSVSVPKVRGDCPCHSLWPETTSSPLFSISDLFGLISFFAWMYFFLIEPRHSLSAHSEASCHCGVSSA